MAVLYSLQHLGYTIPQQADADRIGEEGPGPSYGDDGAGLDNGYTDRNTSFMAYNYMHIAKMLRDNRGMPAYGNQWDKWNADDRPDTENPEHR